MPENALIPIALDDSGRELDVALPPELQDGLDAVIALADAAIAATTRATYERAFRRFSVWAEGHGLTHLPASKGTVAAYLGLLHKRALTPSRIGVIMSAIRWYHRRAGEPDPTMDDKIAMAVRGARRKDAARTKKKAHALLAKGDGGLPGEVHRLVEAITGDNLVALRDRAVILLGFAGAFRRSELAALTLADLEWTPRGLLVTVRRSKTDQEGLGLRKAIVPGQLHCPVAALKRWLTALDAATGREKVAGQGRARLPVFVGFSRPRADGSEVPKAAPMSDQVVPLILKRYAEAAGLDPAVVSGHSLRRGFATSAAQAGADLLKIRQLTGHKSVQMLTEYVEAVGAFENNAGRGLL